MFSLDAQSIWLDGNDPCVNLETEEKLFREADELSALCLFYLNAECIVLGRNNDVAEWIAVDNVNADGIPVHRRFSGGGTVFHNLDVLNYSFTVPRSLLPALAGMAGDKHQHKPSIRAFTGIALDALSRLGPGFSATRTSDISLNGLKISGNAQRIARLKVLHHGTILLKCPISEMERYLATPPDRPGIPHRGFVTGLSEEGYEVTPQDIASLISQAFLNAVLQASKQIKAGTVPLSGH